MGTVGMWTYDILVVVNLLGVNVAYTVYIIYTLIILIL